MFKLLITEYLNNKHIKITILETSFNSVSNLNFIIIWHEYFNSFEKLFLRIWSKLLYFWKRFLCPFNKLRLLACFVINIFWQLLLIIVFCKVIVWKEVK
jgi:hypothetical protein